MKVEKSVNISNADHMTAGEFKNFLESVPITAKVWISTHAGDYNQMDYHSIEFSWTEDV